VHTDGAHYRSPPAPRSDESATSLQGLQVDNRQIAHLAHRDLLSPCPTCSSRSPTAQAPHFRQTSHSGPRPAPRDSCFRPRPLRLALSALSEAVEDDPPPATGATTSCHRGVRADCACGEKVREMTCADRLRFGHVFQKIDVVGRTGRHQVCHVCYYVRINDTCGR